jgi:ubiquinone/menaquinone biosynthesis C-methylase UbiE
MSLESLHHKVFASLYDNVNGAAERTWLGRAREELLAGVTGDVIEIGGGTGANIEHYRDARRVVVTEPDDAMRTRLDRNHLARAKVPVELSADPAEALQFPDDTFDVAVSTLVLCTVPNPRAALGELRRVLRPEGRLLFIEHVRGEDGPRLRWKRRLEPAWSWFALGCRITQDTVGLLEREGFDVDVHRVHEPSRVPPIVKPFVAGEARP